MRDIASVMRDSRMCDVRTGADLYGGASTMLQPGDFEAAFQWCMLFHVDTLMRQLPPYLHTLETAAGLFAAYCAITL